MQKEEVVRWEFYRSGSISAAMTVQDQSGGGSRPNAILVGRSEFSLGAGLRSLNTSIQFKEQASSGSDYSPKVRKPYTITKQRERWTEDEHKKFLEALKLYGRAWRRIEEHVGTKTAVQIRSHAQKFFSKVVRDSSGGSVELIEIPPPRPKRKPVHPYPRKLLSTERSKEDRPRRSSSPNSSVSEQDQHSPTSVLSAVCSSSGTLCPVEEFGSSSPLPVLDPVAAVDSVLNEKLELFLDLCRTSKDDEAQEASVCPRSFKLFGTMLQVQVGDAGQSASKSNDTNEGEDREVHNNADCLELKRQPLISMSSDDDQTGFLAGSRVDLGRHDEYTKGFLPYKRPLEERSGHSDSRDKQRIRLRL